MRLGAAHFVHVVPGYGVQCRASPGCSVTYVERLHAVRLKLDEQPETLVPLHNVASMDMPAEAHGELE